MSSYLTIAAKKSQSRNHTIAPPEYDVDLPKLVAEDSKTRYDRDMIHPRGVAILLSMLFLSALLSYAQDDVAPMKTIIVSDTPLDAIEFAPDGMLLAVGGRDDLIRLYDAATHALRQTLYGHQGWIRRLAFNHAGTQLASGSRDGSVILWDAAAGKPTLRLTIAPDIEARGLIYTLDDSTLYIATQDGVIYRVLLATTQPEIVVTTSASIWDIALSPDEKMLLWASEDGSVYVHDLSTNTPMAQLTGSISPATRLAFSADGRWVAAGALDGIARVWDWHVITQPAQTEYLPAIILQGHLAPILGLRFAADDTALITTSLDGTTRIWEFNGAASTEIALLHTDNKPLTALALASDANTVATTGTNGQITLWDVRPPTIAAWRKPTPAPTAIVQAVRTQAPAVVEAPPNDPVPPPSGAHLAIPSARIQTGLTTFPLGSITWEIDPWEKLAGHFAYTAWLNTTGNIVIGGHSEFPNGAPGIFSRLTSVGIGDEIFLSDDGIQRRYVVVNILKVDYREVSVVYPTPNNRLTLITCDIPSYVKEQNIYYERLVIVADEAPSS